jgi:hypothetical protein
LLAARTVLTLLKLLQDNRPRTICDIGGGTGSTARCWLTNSAHRPQIVVIVDIPETLVYSEALLQRRHGSSAKCCFGSPARSGTKNSLKVSTEYEKPATRRLTNHIPGCVEAAGPEYHHIGTQSSAIA